MNKIRVLHMIETVGRGGAERRLANDLKCLDKEKFENIVCSFSEINANDLACEIESLGIKIISLNFVNYRFKFKFSKLLVLRNILKTYSIDIIHSHLFFPDFYAALLSFLFPKKIFVRTLQSTPYFRKDTHFYSRKRFFLEKFVFPRRFHQCIAVSNAAMDMAIQNLNYHPGNVMMIPNSVDSIYLKEPDPAEVESLRQELGIDQNLIIVLTIGRWVHEKGHHILLKALQRVVQDYTNFKLVMVGRGPLEEQLRRMISELGLDGYVTMIGAGRADMVHFLSLSDFFVFPSLEGEGLPVALLEALAAGKTCLVADTKPVRDVIKDEVTGYLYGPEDFNQLSELLLKLVQGEKNRDLKHNARKVIENGYLDHKCAKKLEDLYCSFQRFKDIPSTNNLR